MSTVSPSSMLVMPVYTLLQPTFSETMQGMAETMEVPTTEIGEYFLMAIAERKASSEILEADFIVVPLVALDSDQTADATFLATAPIMFLKVVGVPQTFMTYGVCAAYYGPVAAAPYAIGDRLKLPTTGHYLIARPGVVETLGELLHASMGSSQPPKRTCNRQLDDGGELTNTTPEKGTFKFLVDLEGGRHFTRNKTDLGTRETDLAFLFRALDVQRRESAMGVDFSLQTEKYRGIIIEEAKTRIELRNPAFTSCGLYDRVFNLTLFTDPVKLKLFLTGNVLTEEVETVTLSDFKGSQSISENDAICPDKNAPLVATLQNLQIVLQVLLSCDFAEALEPFILHLQGVERPLELVKANLLKYTVEAALRKFFKVLRSERTGSTLIPNKVSTPGECSIYLQKLLNELKETLSNHQLRGVEESYFQLRAGLNISSAKITTKVTSVKSEIKSQTSIIGSKAATKACVGFIGGQLKANSTNGVPYKCQYGDDCKFRHLKLKGKTNEQISAVIALFPAAAKADCLKAILVKS